MHRLNANNTKNTVIQRRSNLRIPNKLSLAGIDIKVKYVENMITEEERVGRTDFEGQVISLASNVRGTDVQMQTFIHELVHYILYVQGKMELSKDEEFVDGFAHLLWQAIKQTE